LPARPNLSYLKKLAKERLRSLRQSNGSSKLADAQLAIAREHGFRSWRALKAHVDAAMQGASEVATDELSAKVDAFLAAAVSHHTDEKPFLLRRADALLAEDPRIAGANLLTACVLGTVKAAQAFLSRDAKAATHPAGPKNWPPILYLAFSRYLKFKPKLEAQFVAIARTLLDAGADPNSMFVHEGFNETPLYGAAGIANRPKLTKLLLDAGADPDDGGEKSGMESLYHAAEHLDNKCLRLILAKKPRRDAVSYCLARKLDFEDAAGTKLMLDQGTDSNFIMPAGSNCVLHAIRRGRSVEILKLLQSYGAQLDLPDKSSMTPLKLARRLGQKETIKFLLRAGVRDSLDVCEQFLAACAAGSMRTAGRF
jgi:ankyrin repeat protein